MSSENIRNLVRFRLDQADAAARAAQVLLDQDLFRDAVNRSYYAYMFYAVLALLVTKQIGTSKHQSAISIFDREFVRAGVLNRELSYWLHEAFEMRLDIRREGRSTHRPSRSLSGNLLSPSQSP